MGIRINETGERLTVGTGFPIVGLLLWIATAANGIAAFVQLAGGATPYQVLWWAAIIITMSYVSWLFGESSRFSFSRASNQFSWMHRRLLCKRRGHVSLSTVKKARCDMIYAGGDGADFPVYRLIVETLADPVPLTDAFSGNRGDLSNAADRINSFLNDENTT